MPSAPLLAKSESPNATSRVSAGLGASPPFAGSVGAGVTVAAADTAEASATGPCLSPASIFAGCPPERLVRFDSAQLFLLVSTIFWAVCPFTPPSTGDIDRASGYADSRLKFSVIGCGG